MPEERTEKKFANAEEIKDVNKIREILKKFTESLKEGADGKNLSTDAIKNFNAVWHAINDGDVYIDERDNKEYSFKSVYKNSSKKRDAFDVVYDAATDYVLGSVPDNVKEYMHKAWLNYGFELGDGNDKAFNKAREILEGLNEVSADNKLRAFKFVLENYDRVDDELDTSGAKNLLKVRKDIWDGTYKDQDIRKILVAVSKGALKNFETPDNSWKDPKFNLRDLIGGAPDVQDTIKVRPMNEKDPEDIARYLKAGGLDIKNSDDIALLQDLLNKANQQLKSS